MYEKEEAKKNSEIRTNKVPLVHFPTTFEDKLELYNFKRNNPDHGQVFYSFDDLSIEKFQLLIRSLTFTMTLQVNSLMRQGFSSCANLQKHIQTLKGNEKTFDIADNRDSKTGVKFEFVFFFFNTKLNYFIDYWCLRQWGIRDNQVQDRQQ